MATDRKSRLIMLFLANDRPSVERIATTLGTSLAIIQRDLIELEKMGRIEQRNGSAHIATGSRKALAFWEREQGCIDAKCTIAFAASQRTRPNERPFGDAGTAVLQLVRYIRGMGSSIKIFTKGLVVAQEFAHVPSIELTLIGGRARIEKLSTVGSAASSMMEELWCDCLFLGKKAIDVEEELISLDAEEAAINAQMVRRSARVTDFADSSKFGSRVTHSVEQLAIGHTPTSEAEPTGEFAKYIERSGVDFAPTETEKSQQVIHA